VLGLLLILGIIYIFLRRTRQSPEQAQEVTAILPSVHQQPEKLIVPIVSPVKSDSSPTAAFKRLVQGRPELDSTESKPENVAQADSTQLTEVQGEGRDGLRPEELDANGQYVGDLHGDGRHSTGAELP
jgi:hypothetical protein